MSCAIIWSALSHISWISSIAVAKPLECAPQVHQQLPQVPLSRENCQVGISLPTALECQLHVRKKISLKAQDATESFKRFEPKISNMYWHWFCVSKLPSSTSFTTGHNTSKSPLAMMFFWLSSPFPFTLLFPLYHYLTKAHGFLTASYRTVGPGAAAWSLPAAAEGIAAFHRALLPIPWAAPVVDGDCLAQPLVGSTDVPCCRGCILQCRHDVLDLLQAKGEVSRQQRSGPSWWPWPQTGLPGPLGLYRTFIVGFGGASRRTCQERQNRCFLPSSTVQRCSLL